MTSYHASTTIRASAEAVWRILGDTSRWIEWNPTIDEIEGEIALGEKILVRAKISPGRAFPVRVSGLVPPHLMIWTGGMPLGLFRGERSFTLEDREDGSCEFTMHEDFTGLLAPLITRSMPDLQPTFDAFCEALKARAEAT